MPMVESVLSAENSNYEMNSIEIRYDITVAVLDAGTVWINSTTSTENLPIGKRIGSINTKEDI